MILRLVFSYFFLSVVTGNQQLDVKPAESAEPNGSSEPCFKEVCACDDQQHKNLAETSSPTQVRQSTQLRVTEVSQPNQYADDEVQISEKTICFTPIMVQKIIKAALEYVTQIPIELNHIVDQIDQELNKVPELDSKEDSTVTQSAYPIDSKTIYQMLSKPRTPTRTNLILKYQLPSEQGPNCKEALEKLIEIAYKAYLELEHHPQCRDYLYKFASTPQQDRPRGYIEKGKPDIKSLIATILEEIQKQRPTNTTPTHESDRYGGFEVPKKDNHTPQKNPVKQDPEYTMSPIPDRVPKTKTLPIVEQAHPPRQKITFPPSPSPQEDKIIKKTTMPIKQEPAKPIQPEDTMNLITKLLQTSDHPNNKNAYDRIIKLVNLNNKIFHPQLLKQILTLLKTHKQNKVPRIRELLLSLLNVQRNPHLKDHYTDALLTYLHPNHLGQYDARLVDVLLYLINKRPSLSEAGYILSLLHPFKLGLPTTGDYAEIAFNVIRQIQNNVLTREQINIILDLLTPYLPDLHNHNKERAVIVAKELSKWDGTEISPKQFHILLKILKPHVNSSKDQRAIDIVYFLLTNGHRLTPQSKEVILSFLSPQNGSIDSRRLDLIHIIFNELMRSPKHGLLLLTLLIENGPNILNSKYVEILLLLKHYKLVTIELLDILVKLLNDEINGQIDTKKIKTLVYQLIPYRKHNPKLVIDILTLLNQGGLHGNILQLLQSPHDNEPPVKVVIETPESQMPPIDVSNEYRTPDGGYETKTTEDSSPTTLNPENDLVHIFKWLKSHGLLNPDQTSNNELVNKILKILQLGERELGVLELTYMLKHAKPLIYQPVYYVKYRLPILSFISNMKTLLVENPNLNADPMKLLQELIVVSNVTEVSPDLQGYPKDEILKLTLNDGDLVQAKILDEQNMNLNDQIMYVHTLNSDISPEELLQMNELNEAKYFPSLIQVNDPSKLTILKKTIDKFVEFPPVQYKQVITTSNPGVAQETRTIQQTYIERTNQQTTPESVPQTIILPIK